MGKRTQLNLRQQTHCMCVCARQVAYLLGAAPRDTAVLHRCDKASVSWDVTQIPYWFCNGSIFSPPQPPVPL